MQYLNRGFLSPLYDSQFRIPDPVSPKILVLRFTRCDSSWKGAIISKAEPLIIWSSVRPVTRGTFWRSKWQLLGIIPPNDRSEVPSKSFARYAILLPG
jgi:hypothetical protein